MAEPVVGAGLPAPALLAVRSAVAPLQSEARVSSPQVSQVLAGHVVEVLGREGDWLRVRAEDDYEGWLHGGYVEPAEAAAPPATRRVSLGCVVRDAATGHRRALPLGARLAEKAVLESGAAVEASALAHRFPRAATAIAQSAVSLFEGAPYQWGGITPWGADCSGLVQTVFGLHGVRLPRDAWQQAAKGVNAGSDLRRLQPADLLFFSDRQDGRVTHVAVALGGMRMVHLALGRGGYAIEQLDRPTDDYVKALVGRFLGARRAV